MQKNRAEMEEMAAIAKEAAGWDEGDEGCVHRPFGASDGLSGLSGEFDIDKELRDRAYAEGVEAGILWALGSAGNPFPR